MVEAVSDSDNREDNERRNLNDIDRSIYGRCSAHTPVADIRNTESKDRAKDDHEQWARYCCVKGIRPDRSDHVTDNQSCHAHHQSGINPIIEVTRPAYDELRNSCELVCACFAQKGLFRKIIRGTRSWIELRELRVCNRGSQA